MKKTYDDYYAQVRKVSGDRKIVYFWINNLLKEDFVKRNHSKLLFIPTNIGISLSYDILFYKRYKLLRK